MRTTSLSAAPSAADQVEILSRETCYQGFFRIDRYQLRHRLVEGGWSDPVWRETFERGHAVAVLPYDPVLDRVVLIEQIRMAPLVGGDNPWMLEIPAGMIEEGESPEDVARRECLEETGLGAHELIPLMSYYPSPGAATEKIDLFVTRVDAAAPPTRAGLSEDGEDIRVLAVAWEEAEALLAAGRLNNAATIIALQWLAARRPALRADWAQTGLPTGLPTGLGETCVTASALVSTDWLADHLGDPQVKIVDAAFFLPHHGRDADAEHLARRIPGAVRFDVDALAADPATVEGLPHMLPSPEDFAAKVGALGIGDQDFVVAYDPFGLMSAPRAWWMFRVFGHDKVAVLDGGLPKWLAEDRPTAAGPAAAPEPKHYTPAFRPELVVDWKRVRDVMGSDAQIVDARPAARFRGDAPEPRPGLRSGHMPGALNLPYDAVADAATKTLLPPQKLAAVVKASGLDPAGPGPIIASCGSGVTACVLALALYELGRKDAAVYDGSWAEWGGRADLSLAMGDA